jgi:hypothetical protein
MSQSNSEEHRYYPLLELILTLLRGDFATLAIKFVLPHLPRLFRPNAGMYEVLEHHSQLELLDSKGNQALLTKYQKVLFLQDNITVIAR